jgi:hypothetical protein
MNTQIKNIYECNKCYKRFKYNYLLERHINSIKVCNIPVNIIKNIDNNIIEYDRLSIESLTTCYYCKKIYKRKDNLKRHITNTCKTRKQLIKHKNIYINNECNNSDNSNNSNNSDNNNIVETKESELSELKKEIIDLKKCIIDIKNINVPTTIQNIDKVDNSKNVNIVVNINDINSYGKEDLSHINDKDYIGYLSRFLPGLIKYIEDVHFSDKMPSNHNLCISKLDSKYISIYDENKWNVKDKDEQLKKIITKKLSILDKKCEELNKNGIIEEDIADKFNELFNNYYKGPEHTKQKFKDELEMLIFNNRHKINNYKYILK